MMQTWFLWHGQDGWEVELVEVPWWTSVLETAATVIDIATGHWLCGARSDVLFKVPLGRPRFDEPDEDGYRYLENSLGGWLHDAFGFAICADVRFAKSLHRFPVSEELALALGGRRWEDEEE